MYLIIYTHIYMIMCMEAVKRRLKLSPVLRELYSLRFPVISLIMVDATSYKYTPKQMLLVLLESGLFV